MSFVSVERKGGEGRGGRGGKGGEVEKKGGKSFINLLENKTYARKQVYCKTIFACGR